MVEYCDWKVDTKASDLEMPKAGLQYELVLDVHFVEDADVDPARTLQDKT